MLRLGDNRTRRRRPRKSCGSMRCAITQRLEGSRFGAHLAALAHFVAMPIRARRVKTSGSRKQPSVMHLPVTFDSFKRGL